MYRRVEDCQRQRLRAAIALLSLACVAAVQFWSAPALACSCLQRSPAEAYEQAVAVFEGHVIDLQRLEPAAGQQIPELKVRFAVVRSWKGMEQEQVELTTASDSAGCGVPFTKDGDYLVYASASANGLSASLCSRTRAITEATEDLRVLGMGATPVDPHLPSDETGGKATPAASQPKPLEPAHGGCAGCVLTQGRQQTPVPATWLALGSLAVLRLRRRFWKASPTR
jgi:hypothetical protein